VEISNEEKDDMKKRCMIGFLCLYMLNVFGQQPDSAKGAMLPAPPHPVTEVPAAKPFKDTVLKVTAGDSVKTIVRDTGGPRSAVPAKVNSVQSGNTSKVSRVVGIVSQTQPVEFSLEIPGGVLFGKFEKESGPFLIKGSIIVPAGQVLEFGPGCKIYVSGDYTTITVFGQIIVKGTREEPVIFQSARHHPNPWDWDRLYIRSRNRSSFEHCIIRHSNYGVMVENGSIMMNYCQFDHNSLHALVVRNSDALIMNTSIQGGQVVSILCEAGGDIQADSLMINGNITGVAVGDKGSFHMRGGDISHNANGIVAMQGSSVSIVAADITGNRIGLVSQQPIPKKMSEMNYGNGLDVKIATTAEIEKMLKPPESVKSVSLPKSTTNIRVKDDFVPGFSAMRAPHEATTSFIGNVTTGFQYFAPQSGIDTLRQSHYPGEDNPAIGRVDNLQPEMQVFASGKKGDADVNLMLDVYGNDWAGFRRNNTNLSMNYSDQSVVIGDFYENNSETSISGRKLTGLKYDGNFWEMGRGTKRVSIKAAFGQSELPKMVGEHELDMYNSYVDSGMSVRQQMTYEAALTFKPTFYSSISARGLIARDQGNNTFIGSEVVDDPKAPNLMQAQTGCIDGKIDILNGKISITAELDMGRVDTLVDTMAMYNDRISKIAWYDPQAPDAISKVFGVISNGKNYAFTLGCNGLFDGYKLAVSASQIAPSFFAAGNPYLELDRRDFTFTGEKEYSEQLAASLGLDYQKRTISTNPVDNTTLRGASKYAFGKNLPEVNGDYMFYYETNQERQSVSQQILIDSISSSVRDTSFDSVYQIRDYKNQIGLELKQQLANDMDYSIKYQLLLETDNTNYINEADKNKRSGVQHQLSARYGFKVGKSVRNRTTIRFISKNEVQDSLKGFAYKIGDELKLSLIPRKLTWSLKGEYSNKLDKKVVATSDESGATVLDHQSLRTILTSFETEVKYSLTSKWSLTARGRYENSIDDTPGSRENYVAKIFGFYCTYLF